MRLAYQRLRWDSAAIQRILKGDTSRKRRLHTQAQGVWNLANMLLRTEKMGGLFPTQTMKPVKKTTLGDLVEAGYVLQGVTGDWSTEEVKMFFGACQRYRRVGQPMLGAYAGVYEWIATSVLKGGRSTAQVRSFAETVFNARKKRRRQVHEGENEGTHNKEADENQMGMQGEQGNEHAAFLQDADLI